MSSPTTLPTISQPMPSPMPSPMSQQDKIMTLFNHGMGFGLTGFTIILYMLFNFFLHKNYKSIIVLIVGILFLIVGIFNLIQYFMLTNPMMMMVQ